MENKIYNQKLAAQNYINSYNIETIISEMLNSLVHEKSKSPIVYMIKYLAGLLSEQEKKQHNLVIPEPYPKGKPIVKFPSIPETSNSLLKKYLSKSIWSQLKYNRTKYNGTIMDIIKLGEVDINSEIGLALSDSDCLEQFQNLLEPIVQDIHELYDEESKTVIKHNYNIKKSKLIDENKSNNFINFPFQNSINSSIKNLKIEFSRNLEEFPFSSIISKEKRESIIKTIKAAIQTLSTEEPLLKKGQLFNITSEEEINIKEQLEEVGMDYDSLNSYMISANLKSGWPENRAVYISENKELIILINFVDNLKFIFNAEYIGDFEEILERAYSIVKCFERILNFESTSNFGYITVCPSLLGAGLEIQCDIQLKNLNTKEEIDTLLKKIRFGNYSLDLTNSLLKVKSKFKLKYNSEFDFLKQFYSNVCSLINLDIDSSKLKTLNFNKKEFEEESGETCLTYFKSYDTYEGKISPSGININSLLINDLTLERDYGCFVFKEVSDIFYFKSLLATYYNNYFCFKTDYNPEYTEENLYFETNDEDFSFQDIKNNDKISSLKVIFKRNLEGIHFTCSKYSDNNPVYEKVKILEKQDFITNFEIIDSEEYLVQLESIDNNQNPENINSIVKVHQALHRNQAEIQATDKNPLLKNLKYDVNARKIAKLDFKDLKDILVFVNDIDHFRLEYLLLEKQVNQANIKKLLRLIGEISECIHFAIDDYLGYYGPLPKFYGTAAIYSISLELNNDFKNDNEISVKFNQILDNYNFILKSSILSKTNTFLVNLESRNSIFTNEARQAKQVLELINSLIILDDSININKSENETKNDYLEDENKKDNTIKEEKESEMSNKKEENKDLIDSDKEKLEPPAESSGKED